MENKPEDQEMQNLIDASFELGIQEGKNQSQSQLKEIRDKVENLTPDGFTNGVNTLYFKDAKDKVLEILDSYIK